MKIRDKAFDPKQTFVVTLDGPAASGKGTVARILARKLRLKYIQSSIVYRSLAALCIKNNVDLNDEEAIITLSSSPKITNHLVESSASDEQIGSVASKIAVIPEVRDNLNKTLKQWIKETPRIIMEGRDIGTIVAPDADFKIFLTADVKIRAERRYNELREKGKECIMHGILLQLEERDARDSQRKAGPLKEAPGSFRVNTSDITPLEAVDEIINNIIKR